MSAESTPTFEIRPVDSALDFLVNAARVSPVLRAKVQIVEDEIRRLRLALVELYRFVQVEFETAPYDHEMWTYMTDPGAIEVARGLQEMADNGGRWEE